MRIPRLFRFTLVYLLAFIALGILIRLGFATAFGNKADPLPGRLLAESILLGARFDLRLGLLSLAPMLLLGGFKLTTPFKEGLAKRLWLVWFALVFAVLIFSHMVDFAHYSYLGVKLSASVLNFLYNLDESAGMVWSTYPVGKLTLVWALSVALLTWGVAGLMRRVSRFAGWEAGKWKTSLLVLVSLLATLLGIHGKFSQYPLRWSDAYYTTNSFAAAVALNPALNFYDTMSYTKDTYSIDDVRAAYPAVAAYLGVDHPDAKTLNFERHIQPKPTAFKGQPNVVMVYLESFSGYKTSLYGNPLDTTPFFTQMAKESIWFDHLYTPHFGTARGIFAGLSGIPDVDLRDTSSRNPAAVNQNVLINAFKGYEKDYFIGGSTTWANVRGVLTKNIDGLKIHEEGSYSAPRNDVWGISDKNLFYEANKVFREKKSPFFAVIQTSGNHRPYTIPAEDTDFKLKNPSVAELHANGFAAVDEYNSFRYMDYCIEKFMQTARKEAYFDNTVFVFFGDHGIRAMGHDVGPNVPRAFQDLKLSSVHTPFILYAPKLLKPARYDKTASQIDILPTIAGLFNLSYINKGMGRDLLDPRFDASRFAFTIYPDEGGEIGILDKDWYYIMQVGKKSGGLFDMKSNTPSADKASEHPDIAARMKQQLRDYYTVSDYMLTHSGGK